MTIYSNERLAVPSAQIIHGEDGGLPSHQQKITYKIETLPGIVTTIGFQHVIRVVNVFLCAVFAGAIGLFYERIRRKLAATTRRTIPRQNYPRSTIEERYRDCIRRRQMATSSKF